MPSGSRSARFCPMATNLMHNVNNDNDPGGKVGMKGKMGKEGEK